jgi:hypothetical protein
MPPCSAEAKTGYAIHMYTANTSMEDCCLASADGDMLLVPQQGEQHSAVQRRLLWFAMAAQMNYAPAAAACSFTPIAFLCQASSRLLQQRQTASSVLLHHAV